MAQKAQAKQKPPPFLERAIELEFLVVRYLRTYEAGLLSDPKPRNRT
jgi:hypothetical protein